MTFNEVKSRRSVMAIIGENTEEIKCLREGNFETGWLFWALE